MFNRIINYNTILFSNEKKLELLIIVKNTAFNKNEKQSLRIKIKI